MDLSLSSFRSLLLTENISDHQLKNGIKIVHDNFTINRNRIDDYLHSDLLVSAYTAFYFPTNFLKFSFIANQIFPEVFLKMIKYSFIDFGSGPGTFLAAYLDYLNSKNHTQAEKLFCIDKAEKMLQQSKRIIGHYFPDDLPNISFQKNIPNIGPRSSTLFLGNSLNEMGIDYFLSVEKKLKPAFLWFISPGTTYMFEMLQKLNKELAQLDYQLIYPCFNSNIKNCPMNKRKNDWCHQVLKRTLPADIERLSQISSLDRKTMPLISHFYIHSSVKISETPSDILQKQHTFSTQVCLSSKEAAGSQISSTCQKDKIIFCFRVVQFLQETKFSYELIGCDLNICSAPFSSVSVDPFELTDMIQLQIQKKTINKKTKQFFEKMNIGEALIVEVTKKINDRYYRVIPLI